MGKFQEMVDCITADLESKIQECGGIEPKDLPSVIGEQGKVASGWNCYPGLPDGQCCVSAVFYSLTLGVFALAKKPIKGEIKHLSFSEAIKEIIQHWARCQNTKNIVFVTDNWDAKAFDKWRLTLEKIKSKIQEKNGFFEIYLIMREKKAIEIILN